MTSAHPHVHLPATSRLLAAGLGPAAVRHLRDTGHEVVLLAPGTSPEVVAAIAEQEDVAAVAVEDPAHGAALAALLSADTDADTDAETVVFCVT